MFSIPDSVEEENFRGARHGDAFFVPEIEVAVIYEKEMCQN